MRNSLILVLLCVSFFSINNCSSPTTPQTVTKYIHDTITVQPNNHVGTWIASDISYSSGNKGIWTLSLTSSETFSFSRMDTTDDTKSFYYFGSYTADGVTLALNATTYKQGKFGTTSTCNKNDVCAYTMSPANIYIQITENGPDFLFNTATNMYFYKN